MKQLTRSRRKSRRNPRVAARGFLFAGALGDSWVFVSQKPPDGDFTSVEPQQSGRSDHTRLFICAGDVLLGESSAVDAEVTEG